MEACWQSLAPELVDQVLHHLAPNERATTARRLSKEYHERYKTSLAVHLRRPLPLHALREAFEGPTALPSVLHRDVVAAVAASANLDSLRWISQQGLNWDARACRAAAAEGHAALLSWLMEQGAPVDASVATAAARAGHLALVQQLHAQGCPLNKFTCYAAAERGHLLVLQWVVEVARAPVDARICELAAVNGGCCPPPAASVTQGGGGGPACPALQPPAPAGPAASSRSLHTLIPQAPPSLLQPLLPPACCAPRRAPGSAGIRTGARHHRGANSLHGCRSSRGRPPTRPGVAGGAGLRAHRGGGHWRSSARPHGGCVPLLPPRGLPGATWRVCSPAPALGPAWGHMAGVFPCSRPGACLEEER